MNELVVFTIIVGAAAVCLVYIVYKRGKSMYNPELDQIAPLVKLYNNYLTVHLFYNDFQVDLTVYAVAHKRFNMYWLSKHPALMSAYRRAGSPPVGQPYVHVKVIPSGSKESNKTKPYIPMELIDTICIETDLVASTQKVIIELNHYFGSKPCVCCVR